MDPIKNPYAPGAGAPPPELAGRDREIELFTILAGRLQAGRPIKNMMLTGLRGVGKTVLLTTFQDIAENKKFLTGLTEITHEMEFKPTITRLARRIIIGLKPSEKIKDGAWKAAGILKAFSLRIKGIELGMDVEAIRGTGDSGDFGEDLADLFVGIGNAAKERKTCAIFLLDEIQFLKRPDFEALIAATHKVGQRTLPLAVIGAGLPQLPRLAGEAKSYAERLFDFPKIDRLEGPSAKNALELPAEKYGVHYDPAATEAILRFTEGYPYFLQEYGKHVWNVAGSATITPADVKAARANVVTQLDENFFRVRMDRTTVAERSYVIAMAHLGRGPYKTGDIAASLKRDSTTVAPLRGHLINKGLVYSPAYGLTDFTVPQFDDFVRRNFSLEKSRAAARYRFG